MDEYIIKTEKLCYSYDEKNALDNINISITKGEITAILGGNGAGKSTLFLNLNGVLEKDSGKIFFDGEEIIYNQKNIKKLSKEIGIVFQDPNDQLFSDSVRNDIAFGAINMGQSQKEIQDNIDLVSKQTGISDLLDKPVHALSFGQKKRVAIAGVLIMNPKLIILDEPTAGLDPQGVTEILTLLTKIKEETNITIILSTHEIDLVPLYCTYVYVLNTGKVVLSGTPKEIFKNAKELRGYNLRVPRITHLMEILNKKDNIDVDTTASTISQARKTIVKLVKKGEK